MQMEMWSNGDGWGTLGVCDPAAKPNARAGLHDFPFRQLTQKTYLCFSRYVDEILGEWRRDPSDPVFIAVIAEC